MSSITKEWTEELFRKELKKIDDFVYKKMGIVLEGATLPITLKNRSYLLGTFSQRDMAFTFSVNFFNTDIPEECAIDIIRHEYAHYYAYAVLGYKGGHGKEFKIACNIVGARPSTHYSREFEKYKRYFEEQRNAHYETVFYITERITHPHFGQGMVTDIEEGRDSAILTVDFGDKGIKKVDEKWLLKFYDENMM